MTGTLATIAASFAGLFSYKLAKELGARGVNKGTVGRIAANTAASTVQVGVRAMVSVGIAAAYAVASVVSLVVWVLTKLGESVLYVAELTSRLKPSPDQTYPPAGYDPRSFPAPAPEPAAPSGYGASTYESMVANAMPQPPPGGYSSPAAAAYAAAQQRSMGIAPAPAAPPAAPSDPREVGRALAIEQMMTRSSKAAAAARRLEAEKSTILKERQDEAVKKIFEQRRADKMKPSPTNRRPQAGIGLAGAAKAASAAAAAAPARPPPPPIQTRPPARPPPPPSSLAAAAAAARSSGNPGGPASRGNLDVSLAGRLRQQQGATRAPLPTRAPAARAPPSAPPAAAPSKPSQWLPRGVSTGGRGRGRGAQPPAPPPTARGAPQTRAAPPPAPPGGASKASQWLPRGVKFSSPPPPPP